MTSFGERGYETQMSIKTDGLDDGPMPSGQVSPLRRSVRRSAAVASEKIRHGEDLIVNGHSAGMYTDDSGDESVLHSSQYNGVNALQNKPSPPKVPTDPRKLAKRYCLDQFDSHFAIRLNDNGDVEIMSEDESEESISSGEKEALRKQFDSLEKSKPSAEQRHTRKRMIEQLKATLRQEEASLALLKKMRTSQMAPQQRSHASQQRSQQDVLKEQARRMAEMNEQQRRLGEVMARQRQEAQLRQQQEQEVALRTLQQVVTATRTPPAAHSTSRAGGSSNVAGPPPAHQLSTRAQPALDPQQRQMHAKMVLRKSLERNLLGLKPPPPPKTDIPFVPNGNQLDFVVLHGLDLVVQKVLRDKSNTTVPEQPWMCCLCKTDFTPSWQFMRNENAPEDNDSALSVYCEQCFKNNWKRSARQTHTDNIKKEFVTALAREKEIDAMKDGKIDWAKLGLQQPANWEQLINPPPQPMSRVSSSQHLNGTHASSSPGPGNRSTNTTSSSQRQSYSTSQPSAQNAAAALRANQQMLATMNALAAQSGLANSANLQLMQQFAQMFAPQNSRQSTATAQQQQMAMMLAQLGATSNPGMLLNNMPKDFLHSALQQQAYMQQAYNSLRK